MYTIFDQNNIDEYLPPLLVPMEHIYMNLHPWLSPFVLL